MDKAVSIYFAAICFALSVASVSAQAWPNKLIRAVVPVGAGSSTDLVPRAVFEQLSQQLGQPIIVENRAGAGGTIGTAFVARSDADGYTVLASGSVHAITPSLYSNLPYVAARDFAAVIPLGSSPSVLVVAPGSGLRTARELADAARAKTGGLTFSSVGVGTATHLSAERFRLSGNFDAVHVPYKGGAEAMLDVIAGRVDFFFGPVALVLPNVRAGKLVPLAVNGRVRASALPDVPTTSEAGFPDAEYPIWFGLFVPAGTPRGIIDRLQAETMQALQTVKLKERLLAMGVEPMVMTADEFGTFVQKEIDSNAILVKTLDLKPQ